MDSYLTVSDCRIALAQYLLPGSDFIPQLNAVRQRLMTSGKWRGLLQYYIFNSSAGFISLPPQLQAVLGATYDRWPMPVFGNGYEYYSGGPGNFDGTLGWAGVLADMGDGYPTEGDIIVAVPDASPPVTAKPGTVRLYSTGSDDGRTIRLQGIQQESGLPVTDNSGALGELMTLTAPFVDSANHFATLTDADKVLTNGPVAVWVVPSGGGANYQIGTWQPQETRPRRRRYRTGVGDKAVRVLAQVRYTPVTSETDFVDPSNLGALKFGMKAIVQEDQGWEDSGKGNWATALALLDAESTSFRGGAKPAMPMEAWGWGCSIPHQW